MRSCDLISGKLANIVNPRPRDPENSYLEAQRKYSSIRFLLNDSLNTKKPLQERNTLRRLAMNLLEAIATMGYAQAQYDLGNIFIYGRYGIGKNIEKGLRWHRLAAAQKYEDSIRALESIGYFVGHIAYALREGGLKKLQYYLVSQPEKTLYAIKKDSNHYLRYIYLDENFMQDIGLARMLLTLNHRGFDTNAHCRGYEEPAIFRFINVLALLQAESSLQQYYRRKSSLQQNYRGKRDILFNLIAEFGLNALRKARNKGGDTPLQALAKKDELALGQELEKAAEAMAQKRAKVKAEQEAQERAARAKQAAEKDRIAAEARRKRTAEIVERSNIDQRYGQASQVGLFSSLWSLFSTPERQHSDPALREEKQRLTADHDRSSTPISSQTQ